MIQLEAIHSFDTPVGRTAVTVRRGDKWMQRAVDIFAEDQPLFELVQQDPRMREVKTVVGHGALISANLTRFCDISARDIQYEHEESSRLYDGLLASMRRAYGDEFSEDENVTVVTYLRVD